MSTGIIRLAGALVSASVVLAASIVGGGAAGADPGQDARFLALLEEEHIAAVDNEATLIALAHEICGRLDNGTSFDAVLDEETNLVYNDNPLLRLYSARVTTTVVRFITASVDVYCPKHQGQLR